MVRQAVPNTILKSVVPSSITSGTNPAFNAANADLNSGDGQATTFVEYEDPNPLQAALNYANNMVRTWPYYATGTNQVMVCLDSGTYTISTAYAGPSLIPNGNPVHYVPSPIPDPSEGMLERNGAFERDPVERRAAYHNDHFAATLRDISDWRQRDVIFHGVP